MEIAVSVIVPIYKVRNYIERCAQSLMLQTLSNVEFIFVNDATPDDSVDILRRVLQQYPDRLAKIVEHDCNKGLPAARNTGLKEASGEYIYHCDSDDYIECSMLEDMYTTARQKNLDIVYCDYYLTFIKNEKLIHNRDYKDIDGFVKEGLLGGQIKYNVWNKIIKRSLYVDNTISFPEGYAMGEDMTIIRLASRAHTVGFVPKAYYHYNKTNDNAYSIQVTDRFLNDVKYNVTLTEKYLADQGDRFKEDFEYFKINTKLPFLISEDKALHELWRSMWPETNPYIIKNPNHSCRIKILELVARFKFDFVLQIYYRVVHKFVYGVVYK